MTVSEKIKIIDNKIQYNLDKQAAKFSALSWWHFNKCELLKDTDVLPEKDSLEKAATFKQFEYSPVGSELKNQVDIGKKTTSKIRQVLWIQ